MQFLVGVVLVNVHAEIAQASPVNGAFVVFIEDCGEMMHLLAAAVLMPKLSTQRVNDIGLVLYPMVDHTCLLRF
jgi:hypothetical protein